MDSKNQDINEIKLQIKLNNLNNFKPFESKIFYVNGNPWLIKLEKILNGWLNIGLHSLVEDTSDAWAIFAGCTVKLITTKYNKKSLQSAIGPASFHSKMLEWKKTSFIAWNQLMDSNNGYVKDDSCKLEIIIKASPIQDVTKDEWFGFESIRKCCDDTSKGKFRITVKKFDDFIGVCSPEFILNKIAWRIEIYQRECPTKKNSNETSLSLKLYNFNHGTVVSVLRQAKITCKLIPFDSNIEPIHSATDKYEYNCSLCISELDVVSWDQLIDPKNKFINGDSFILEVKIKIKKVDGIKADVKKRSWNTVKLICVICLESLVDRQVSSLSCGHVFCTVCITNSLKRREVCPTCNQEAVAFFLRPIFLPIK